MPLVGLGGYMLNKHNGPPQTPPARITGEFRKIKILPSHNRITGLLFLHYNATYGNKISYDGIKISMLFKPMAQGMNTASNATQALEYCPLETKLPCDHFRGQKRISFTLDIPQDRILPTSFMSSYGSLTYRLVARITRNKEASWEAITDKLLPDFKGYYNISGLEFGASVDFKQFYEEKIISIFTINKPALIIGRDTNFGATLELEGILDFNVDVTVKLLRTTRFGETMKTEIILLQRQQGDFHENNTILKWNFDLPQVSRATYVDANIPNFSVRYFARYEATFKPLKDDGGVLVDGLGFIEVKVGTTSDDGSSSTMSPDPIDPVPHMMIAGRRGSVTSMTTLPPAYSQLSSRSGSVLSLETQPPCYDDLY
ncbi:hypothetical protein Bhyg_06825 [Pseudolycoriella hygida]|uniref:Arrestin-like N-terminal domain-containing protein n=1 Tax=Pseudolycoriella hygida TaxID=35572 RepID=A0A9Q0S3C7_9DIPT|nr:hypothetical protein Bhyg_06825 [Pseudolycoriella hygida]